MSLSRLLACTVPFAILAGCAPEDSPRAGIIDAADCATRYIVGDLRPAPGERARVAAMSEGQFVAVGGQDIIAADTLAACITHLPEGAVAFAGFTDGHAHLIGIGLRDMTLNLEGTASIAELQTRLAEAARQYSEGTVYGRGWIETGWPENRMPTRADLDEVVADRPVILGRADGHAAVVNSAALTAAGITRNTPDPDGGRIERDAEGEATGLLIDTAEQLVSGLMPQLDDARRREALRRGAEVYAAMGWTTVHNMSVEPQEITILADLHAEGALPLRVFNYLVPEALDELAVTGAGCAVRDHVCTMGLKYYADGALGSRGALLFAPYADQPDTSGLQLITRDRAVADFRIALKAGLQVTTHAIGDRGNRLVLDWYEDVLEGVDDPRWRIEHAQIVSIDDIPRFADQGVIASMQPSHAIGDLFFAPARLGSARLRGAYAWRTFRDVGAMVVGGSDAPVERGDPRIEVHAAVRRTALNGFSDDNWHAEEALDAADALALFTTAPAYAVFREDRLGRIAPGHHADMTVFSADPFITAWDEVTVVGTLLGGVWMPADGR